jgi:hypothetical protein
MDQNHDEEMDVGLAEGMEPMLTIFEYENQGYGRLQLSRRWWICINIE